MRRLNTSHTSGLTTIDAMMALLIFSMACAFMLQSNAYALAQHRNALAFQHAVQLINDIAQRWRLNPKRQTTTKLIGVRSTFSMIVEVCLAPPRNGRNAI
ncbi:MAG: hypothetical protein EXR35_07430 [Limnohabitans sp.]|nr:hypothetical protein [Limnohabitans sp.]